MVFSRFLFYNFIKKILIFILLRTFLTNGVILLAMDQYEMIKQLFIENNLIIRTSDLTTRGFHNTKLTSLEKQGSIRKLKRGFYEWIDGTLPAESQVPSDYLLPIENVMIQKLFPDGILCLNSALHHYGYIDRTPAEWHLMFDRDSNKSRFKIDYPSITPHFVMKKYLEFGVSEQVEEDLNLPIYDRERTICDVLKHANKLDRELFNQSIQRYIRDPKKDIIRLVEYGKFMRVTSKIDHWIGVWL